MLSLTTFAVLVVLSVVGLVCMSYWIYQEGQELAHDMEQAVSAKIIERNRISAKTSVLESKYEDILNEQNIWLKQKTKWEKGQAEWDEARNKMELESIQLKKELDISRKMNAENQENLGRQESEMQKSLKFQDELETMIKTLKEENESLVREVEVSKKKLSEEKKNLEERVGQFQQDLEKLSQEKEDELHDRFLIISGLKAEKGRIAEDLRDQIGELQGKLNHLSRESDTAKQQRQELDQQLALKQKEFEQARSIWENEKVELIDRLEKERDQLRYLEKIHYESTLLHSEKEEQSLELLKEEARLRAEQEQQLLVMNEKLEVTKIQYKDTKQRLEESLDEILASHRIEVEEESRKTQELTEQVQRLSQVLDQSQQSYHLRNENLFAEQQKLEKKIQTLEVDLKDREEEARLTRLELEPLKFKNKELVEESHRKCLELEEMHTKNQQLEREINKVTKLESLTADVQPIHVDFKAKVRKIAHENQPASIIQLKMQAEEEKKVSSSHTKKPKKSENFFETPDEELENHGLTYFEKKLMNRVLKAQAIILRLEEENHRLKKQMKKLEVAEHAHNPDLSILKEKIDEARRSLFLIQSETEFDEVG